MKEKAPEKNLFFHFRFSLHDDSKLILTISKIRPRSFHRRKRRKPDYVHDCFFKIITLCLVFSFTSCHWCIEMCLQVYDQTKLCLWTTNDQMTSRPFFTIQSGVVTSFLCWYLICLFALLIITTSHTMSETWWWLSIGQSDVS